LRHLPVLREVDGELGRLEERFRRRIAAALGAQHHVAAGRRFEVEEEIVAAREPRREEVVAFVAAADPDLESGRALVHTWGQSGRDLLLAESPDPLLRRRRYGRRAARDRPGGEAAEQRA